MTVRSRAWLTAACATLVACAAAASARAATFTVTHLGDSGVGSLRAAIISANGMGGADTIVFSLAPGTPQPSSILLMSALPAITGDLTITGPGVDVVWVEPFNSAFNFTIFTVSGNINVEIQKLRILRGRGTDGGGISATGGVLKITECSVEQNAATGMGAGVYMRGSGDATITITKSLIISNTGADNGAGVCMIRDSGKGTIVLSEATIGKNTISTVVAGRAGGGIYLVGPVGPHTITGTNSTIDDNTAPTSGMGGGIHMEGHGGTLSLTNCTVPGNQSSMGAAFSLDQVTATLLNCTLTENNSLGSPGAGCVRAVSGTTLSAKNTILSRNFSGNTFRDLADLQSITGNNNLIGVGGTLVNGVNGNIVGVTDPRLAPLAFLGGVTPVLHLRPDSPALDRGSNADAPALDQRGQARPADGDNDGVAVSDIGAFETQKFVVTTVANSGAGSLRLALDTNNMSGGGFVRFALGAGASFTIAPVTALPTISRSVFIDGWSQIGPAYAGPPIIEIDGNTPAAAIGLDITGFDCIIRGVAVNRFKGSTNLAGTGIAIHGNAGLRNWIYGCYIGVGLDGTTPRGNADTGIYLGPAANNNIIGTNADNIGDTAEWNLISGQSIGGKKTGIYVGSNGNVVSANRIGTNAAGTGAIPNGQYGVWVDAGATSNRIGTGSFTANPMIEGNQISGNTLAGVHIMGQASGTTVSGNLIGTVAGGMAALANGAGVDIVDSSTTVVGGSLPVLRNVISGNTGSGVMITGFDSMTNVVAANYIGLNAAGTAALPNGGVGVSVGGGANGNRIGTFVGAVGFVNVISGNVGRGIHVKDSGTAENDVVGNFVGTDALGVSAIPNGAGIAVIDAVRTNVGGAGLARNIISGNGPGAAAHGVLISGDFAMRNNVQGNRIGVNISGAALGNSGAGAVITGGALENLIGGIDAGTGNTIANNAGGGVVALGNTSLDNGFVGNSIDANTGLGIDLGGDGVTPNGPANVVRVGPNNLTNYPVLLSLNTSGVLNATLAGKANTDYRVEFFSSPSKDPTGFGEGQQLLGGMTVSADGGGNVPQFTFNVPSDPSRPWVTATATELSGAPVAMGSVPLPPGSPLSTSEFSAAIAANTAPTATAQNISTSEDTDLVVTLAGTDPENNPLTFKVTVLPANGSLLQFGTLTPITTTPTAVTDAGGRVVFRPAPNAFGANYAAFNFVANDGSVDSAPAAVTITVNPVADTPNISDSTTTEDVQTASGLVCTRNAVDNTEVTHFKIVGVTNGTLFKNNGTTPINVGDFITFAEGNAGLKFTPAANFSGMGTVQIRASLSSADIGLGGGTATGTITVTAVADTPSVTNTSTPEDTQSTTGLEISRNAGDGVEVTHFKITNITNGTLFQNNGTTPINAGDFITFAQGNAGLRFTPAADFFGAAGFDAQASVSNVNGGLGGAVVHATVTVTPVADTPGITNAMTTEDTQTASGLVCARAGVDGVEVTHFKITGIVNGSLFLNDGTTPVPLNAFITVAQGALGLKFTPAAGLSSPGSTFTVLIRASIGNTDAGLGGGTATGTITVSSAADTPSVTDATTNEDTLSATGQLVISRNTNDGAEVTHFKITNLTNGMLFLNNGTTAVPANTFVTFAQGSAGLRFLPSPDFFGAGGFDVQASLSDMNGGLGGAVAHATATVNPVADTPSITDSATTEDVQTTSGLVCTRNAVDMAEVTHFKIVGITNGALFLNDGMTAVPVNTFITFAQGNAGLRFTPSPDFFGLGTVQIRASISAADGGLGGGTATGTITVSASADTPSITGATTPEDTITSGGLVFTRNPDDGAEVTHIKVTSPVHGMVVQSDGSTVIAPNSFVPIGTTLRFKPDADYFGPAGFDVQAAIGASNTGISPTAHAPVDVTPVADTPSITGATTTENTQTTSGLVCDRDPVDGAEVTHFKVVGITNGALFKANGTTPVNVGDFITFAEGNAGLKFTPGPNLFSPASTFSVQIRASIGGANAGLGGGTATANILVTPDAHTPVFTNATTLEDVISTTGLVLTPSADNGPEVTHFKITEINNGTLFLADGTTPVPVNTFITVAQGAAGLRFLGSQDFNGMTTVKAAASTSNTDSGVTKPPATAGVIVMPVNDAPSFNASDPPATYQNAAPAQVTINGWVTLFSPGPANEGGQGAAEYQVSDVSNPGLFTTAPAVSAGGTLTYKAAASAFGTSTFTVKVRDNGGVDNMGVDLSEPRTFTVTVLPVNQPPSFTAADPPAVLEGTGAKSASGFVSSFSPGPANESGQTVLAYLVDGVSNPGLFAVAPAVSNAGTLTYTLASSGYGVSDFRVRAQDDGGMANGGNDISDPQTFRIIVRPAAKCMDVTIDARLTCPSLKVPLSAINKTPSDAQPGATQTVTPSVDLSLDFAIGQTPVRIDVAYSDGLASSCTANVTVQAVDCNANGVPDTCEMLTGDITDCNHDGIPDQCQCFWNNGTVPAGNLAPLANGQLSHLGGSVPFGAKAADDFYLQPGGIYRIFGFGGALITDSLAAVRKARLEFYDDCDGKPAAVPIVNATFTTQKVDSAVDIGNGFYLVNYSFSFCDQILYLEGGKTYWVSLFGLTDGQGTDSSYWVASNQPGQGPIVGVPPCKTLGISGTFPNFNYGPWESADECCLGCVNLSYCLRGDTCPCIWDNGTPDLSGGMAGMECGTLSGANAGVYPPPRGADNFVVKACATQEVCLIETYIFTNCVPVNGFLEVYANNCDTPTGQPILSLPATKAIPLSGVTCTYQNKTYAGYRLIFDNLSLSLAGGQSYWISSGGKAGTTLNGRGFFAWVNDCRRECQTLISPGVSLNTLDGLWEPTGNDFGFKVYGKASATVGTVSGPPVIRTGGSCAGDINFDGTVTVQDLFDFLSAWFTGCM